MVRRQYRIRNNITVAHTEFPIAKVVCYALAIRQGLVEDFDNIIHAVAVVCEEYGIGTNSGYIFYIDIPFNHFCRA